MPLHPYADDTFERIFAAPPSHPVAAVSVIDETGEVRRRLIAERVLIPAVKRTLSSSKPAIAVPADSETFHRAACQIIETHPIKFAREVADNADNDPRLRAALRTILALPPQAREQMLSRGRKSSGVKK